MSYSDLACYTAWSPNHYYGRAYNIRKITPHHMAGDLSIEDCGSVFASSARQASSNYGIGTDGRIACYVDESNAAWTSSSWENDNQAVTIEVANCECGGDWPVSDAAWNSLIELCVDICQRNGIDGLWYTGDASGNLTEHRMFAATACPGPYLHSLMPQLAEEVNARLGGAAPSWSVPSGGSSGYDSDGSLIVDGYWGSATTSKLQEALGTYVDGEVDDQYAGWEDDNPGLTFGWNWTWETSNGSPMVKALQEKLGVEVDGFIGPDTISALQEYLGTPVDGCISSPSLCVMELQRRLNAGTF
jgi:hypothetical protein